MGGSVSNQVRSLMHGSTSAETNLRRPRPSHFMRKLQNHRAVVIAIVTIVAMLFVPACGSVCAAMSHCSTTAASSNADTCHHADAAIQSGTQSLSSSSTAMCGEQAPLLAVLMNSKTSVQLYSSNTLAASVSLADQNVAPRVSQVETSPSNESPQRSIPLENLSILRI
jgi:hypothetical protein